MNLKDRQLRIWLDAETKDFIERQSEATGATQGELVRRAIAFCRFADQQVRKKGWK